MNSQKNEHGRPQSRPEESAPLEWEILRILRRLRPDWRRDAREFLQELLQTEGGGGHGPEAKPR